VTLLTNSAEGGTNGTTLTTGNTGGASGNAFDAITLSPSATLAFDNTHAGAHGSLAIQAATITSNPNSHADWTSASITAAGQLWFRVYLYFTAFPSASLPVVAWRSGASAAASLKITTVGRISMFQATNTQIGITSNTSTGIIPLNQWFRIEGNAVGSATAGQVQVQTFFTSMDGTTPDETANSSTSQNTTGNLDQMQFGIGNVAALGPFWMDDLGVSDSGALGPFIPPSATPVVQILRGGSASVRETYRQTVMGG
jgi:hypothetical protein